ncbi:MAG: putative HTH-type transcriptional regulator ywhA [Subtercola sp.]|jgi:DNA-binding MarR family transcriptional regulator|nr:putative HTH-type transcriptional regulator ywhA [Subtercola sp.]
MSEKTAARELSETLRPLYRRFSAQRTMSLGKLAVLSRLVEQTRVTASMLAASEKISPQAVMIVVRVLEEHGLVVRERDNEDRRRVWITLTDAGRERYALESTSGQDWLEVAMNEKLTTEERDLLISAIPLLLKITKDAPVD